MTYERDDYMRRQEAEHDMIRMRDPRYDVRNAPSYRDKSGCQYCDGYCHGGCRETGQP